MNLQPAFSRQSTHLLCPSKAGVKYEKAKEWSVPIVDMRWLEEIVICGRIDTDYQPDTAAPESHLLGHAVERANTLTDGRGEGAAPQMTDLAEGEGERHMSHLYGSLMKR